MSRYALGVLWAVAASFFVCFARAQAPLRIGDPVPVVLTPPPANPPPVVSPHVDEAPDLSPFVGQTITRIDVSVEDSAWPVAMRPTVTSVRPGQTMSPALVRRAMDDVLQSGRFAKARVTAVAEASGVRLVVHLVQRRLVETLRMEMHGAPIDRDELLRDADLSEGGELLGVELAEYERRMERYLARRGFPAPTVTITSRDTDDPTRVLLIVDVMAGPPRFLGRRGFYVFDADAHELASTVETYRVAAGARADETALDAADAALEQRLRAKGYHRADVTHDVVLANNIVTLRVRIDAGPHFLPRFEGNDHYDTDALAGALNLEEEADLAPSHLVQKVREFYVKRGYLDVEVSLETRGGDSDRIHYLVFKIIEHARVAVAARAYPCLKEDEIKRLKEGGPQTVGEIGSEIDSYLEEELPGADLLRDPDPKGLDRTIQDHAAPGPRAEPTDLDPNGTYSADTYDRAVQHVQELYRNEGYLHATVGPVQVLRRHCAKRSPPGQCIAIAPKPAAVDECAYDAANLPLPVPPLDPELTCTPDPLHGVECEPKVTLRIPIKLGPRTTLWDLAFDGAHAIPETKLARAAQLGLGAPVNTLKIDEARRRVLDVYKEEGYAFAEVKYTLDASADHTRARVRFEIVEGEQVIVRQIVIRGNEVTNDWTVRRRIALEVGKPYRTSDIRKTEERIATLNVFSTINVALEEPYVPQKNKVVIITVAERAPQYIELRPGFSTGEGFRGTFEYGHRNIGGDAIGITMRATASYLPDEFILDPQVRENFDTLSKGFSGKRLATRLTVSLTFPEIGLGPLVRMGIDGVYVRDLERDFVLQKFAGIPAINFRPFRELQFSLSQAFERNEVQIFGSESVEAYIQDQPNVNTDLARLLRLPNGASFAVAQKFVVTWDRRDNSFSAHSGFFISSGVEHVDWYALGGTANAAEASRGHFVKFTETVAGYIPVTRRVTLAAEVRFGNIVQLTDGSLTYPDRQFFLGGVDSLRGWLQDTFVPQETANEIASQAGRQVDTSLKQSQQCAQKLTIQCVALRGGNFMINPKLELRIPIKDPVETVIFGDAGNLWLDPNYPFNHGFNFRYSAGSGLRIQTPIGPLVFDYGINLSRLFASPNDPRKAYEDFGAFHFAIGLF